MTGSPLIIGIDGGATKVSSWVIDQSSNGFNLGNIHSEKIYSDFPQFDIGFTPINIQTQLKEIDSTINLTKPEQIQGKAIIAAIGGTISELNTGDPMLIGIGMPGLKTVDGRGIAAMANGPRMPMFCDDLEYAISSELEIRLHDPIRRLGSDADYCGMGEEYASDGLFKSIQNGYYLGGGTGVADALKLDGKLIPLDQAKAWLLKSWEMVNRDQVSLERFASAGGIQSIYSQYSDISITNLIADNIFPSIILTRANQKEEPALNTFADVSLNLAELVFERIETIFSGWSGRFDQIDPNRDMISNEHPYIGTIMDRIIIGQRMGALLESSKGTGVLWEPMVYQLGNLINRSNRLDAKGKSSYLVNDTLRPNLLQISTLRDAPALGAGIDAALHRNTDQP